MLTLLSATMRVSLWILVVVLVSACQVTMLEPTDQPSGVATADTVNLHVFGDAEIEIDGARSVLTRRTAGVDLVVETTDLTPGDAYTVWWVVFNNPAACANATCVGSDLSNPDTVGMVGYATGGLADEYGQARFEASLAAEDNSIALDNNDGFPFDLVEPAPGLLQPMTAEIHAVIRTHGAAMDDPTEQITTFNGGCNPDCGNVQAALHIADMVAMK